VDFKAKSHLVLEYLKTCTTLDLVMHCYATIIGA